MQIQSGRTVPLIVIINFVSIFKAFCYFSWKIKSIVHLKNIFSVTSNFECIFKYSKLCLEQSLPYFTVMINCRAYSEFQQIEILERVRDRPFNGKGSCEIADQGADICESVLSHQSTPLNPSMADNLREGGGSIINNNWGNKYA